MTVRILKGDCRDVLRELPAESVHCVVTSPPYWGLRDYGVAGQIGLEATPEDFTAEMVDVFRTVRRVLRQDGTCWLNLGDSYVANRGNTAEKPGYDNKAAAGHAGLAICNFIKPGKPKDLVGIPWRVAFALQADGWYLRQDIIWSKPNPMPESVTDRCTKAHEYLFLLSKSERYFYDAEAIREVCSNNSHGSPNINPGAKNIIREDGGTLGKWTDADKANGRNRRSVWEIATSPYADAHFATFPPALIEPCILAGCPKECCAKCGAPVVRDVERESIALRPNSNSIRGHCASSDVSGSPQRGAVASRSTTLGWSPSCSCGAGYVPGTVLDHFGGAGTTGLVADRLGRNAILIELNPEYAAMAERRIRGDAGMFASVE